jgi:hypothetical protein
MRDDLLASVRSASIHSYRWGRLQALRELMDALEQDRAADVPLSVHRVMAHMRVISDRTDRAIPPHLDTLMEDQP